MQRLLPAVACAALLASSVCGQEPSAAFYIQNSSEFDLVISLRSRTPGVRWSDISVYPGERRRILLLARVNYDIRIKILDGPGWTELGADNVPLPAAATGPQGVIEMDLVRWRAFDGRQIINESPPYPPAGTVPVIGGGGRADADLSFVGTRPNRPIILP